MDGLTVSGMCSFLRIPFFITKTPNSILKKGEIILDNNNLALGEKQRIKEVIRQSKAKRRLELQKRLKNYVISGTINDSMRNFRSFGS
ncbi:hypothetical protein J2S74_002928 [Evansella vedderi]|uniref:Ribosomal protein S13 n=1 Tax=Evansella vedderi TaxID=38282 RepID=A0ABT9ZWD7_9BACI|nr:hypothetical protein [Evansella vedderi]MDQ0255546.1 hypothetical protein [Evansella vedderi]